MGRRSCTRPDSLRKTLMNTMLHHLPLIGFCKLPTRLFNEHSLIHKVLKILVVVANNLDLQARVETSLKALLMSIIRGDVLWSITRELDELVEVFTHRHVALLQLSELILLHFHLSIRDMRVTESF